MRDRNHTFNVNCALESETFHPSPGDCWSHSAFTLKIMSNVIIQYLLFQERESSPPTKYEPEKKDTKPEKPKFRKPLPPPMDFNQLLKLAEQKKSEPIEIGKKKETVTEMEPGAERPMTKKQKREYEEEMARRQRRQERLDAEKGGAKKGM